jgi:hypothetical protein
VRLSFDPEFTKFGRNPKSLKTPDLHHWHCQGASACDLSFANRICVAALSGSRGHFPFPLFRMGIFRFPAQVLYVDERWGGDTRY